MPKEITLEDGSKASVPTDDELKEFNESKANAERLQRELDEAKEAANPNWKAARDKQKALEDELKKANAKLKELGDKPEPRAVTDEEIDERAKVQAAKYVLERHLEAVLASYGDDADKVRAKYMKLSQGEELDESKVSALVEEAARAAGFHEKVSVASRASSVTGSPPARSEGKQDHSQTESGIETAKRMGLSWAQDKK